MSSGLNTLAGTIYEDFIADKMSKDISEKRISDIMKLIAVLLGLACMILVFLVQFLGALFKLTLTVSALAGGPILAMFMLGMLTNFVNTKGILYGISTGMLGVAWLLFGGIYYDLQGQMKPQFKPLLVDECPSYVNITSSVNSTMLLEEDLPPYPYRISFYYYSLIGALLTTLVAVPVSLLSGGREQSIDKDLLSPVVHSFLSYKETKEASFKKDQSELNTLNIIKTSDGLKKEDVIPKGNLETTVIA